MHAAALVPLISLGSNASIFRIWTIIIRANQRCIITQAPSPQSKHGKVPFFTANPMLKLDTKEIQNAIAEILQDRTNFSSVASGSIFPAIINANCLRSAGKTFLL